MAPKDVLRIALLGLLVQKNSFWSSDMASAQDRNDPIIYYTTPELTCSEGYSTQEHKVITEDGYVLTIHRVPNGRNRAKIPRSKNQYHKVHLTHHPDFDDCMRESMNQTSEGFPVLFVHGVLMASDGWFLQGPGQDLAYLMADAGYDIWVANVRGNFYSRKHISLSPSDPEFWDFSFHENAMYDIPAIIDHILKVTKSDKLGYVGLSMGTTIFFSMASMRPEYNEKILGFVGFAPVVFMKEENMYGRRKLLYSIMERTIIELEKKNLHEVFTRTENSVTIADSLCSKRSSFQDLCYDFLSTFLGYHSKLVLRNKFHLYVTHFPTGTSVKTLVHYVKNARGNFFKLFDYGKEKNEAVYGSPTPPDYPVWNITTPVILYYTDRDSFYDVKDIEDLLKLLPNVMHIKESKKINHVDYLWSFKAKDNMYPNVMSLFEQLTDQYYIQKRRKKSIGTKKSEA